MAIRILPSQLIDQIAAGEVVERPASVVKELVENSLDAGRALDRGRRRGRRRARSIRVTDDGCGIARDELALALSRHATSKIATLDDLESLVVDGVSRRGAAEHRFGLAADADVARRRRRACVADRVQRRRARRAAAGARARTAPRIEVRDLFFNTPARRKFLRSEKTELGHVDAVLRNLALARFDVEFRLTSNGRTVFALPAAVGRERRGAARWRPFAATEFMQHARHFERAIEGVRLRGWLAAPAFSRSQADMQFTFVNGRFVRDKLLRHAVRLGYHDVLFQARQPAYVLYVGARPAPRRRQRASGQARDALPRLAARARLRVSHRRSGARKHARGRRRRGGRRARARRAIRRPRALPRRTRARDRSRSRSRPRSVRDYLPLYERLHAAAGGAVVTRGRGGGTAAGLRARAAGRHLRARAERAA